MPQQDKGERIAKVIARSGICSRREAERLITQGKVKVDNQVIHSPALNVTENNSIDVDGKALATKQQTRLWVYHKPKEVITTHNDPQKRKTVFESLPKDMPRVISIGRLDYNTEGLLLLTNNGELSRYVELPKTGWVRGYKVRVFGEIKDKDIEQIKKGITIEGIKYKVVDITREKKAKGKNFWLNFYLKEGKNREIRHICEHFGLKVSRLIRFSYGPFELGNIPVGGIEEVPEKFLKEELAEFI